MSLKPDLKVDDFDQAPDLGGVDLNLLVVMMALLRRGNITHAGRDVRLSQPATSRSLARLRAMFDDDLLIKDSRAFTLSPLAKLIYPRLEATLRDIDELLGNYLPSPERFTLAMPDHQALTLSGHLSSYFRTISPSTLFLPLTGLSKTLSQLESGQVDLVLGNTDDAPPGYFRRALPPAPAAGLCRNGHPAGGGALSYAELGQFLSIRIASGYQTGFGEVYDGLEDLRPRGRETLTVSDIHTAARLLLDTDAVLMLPRRSANYLATRYGLSTFVPRGKAPSEYQISLLWHERSHRDSIHAGVRSIMASIMIEG